MPPELAKEHHEDALYQLLPNHLAEVVGGSVRPEVVRHTGLRPDGAEEEVNLPAGFRPPEGFSMLTHSYLLGNLAAS